MRRYLVLPVLAVCLLVLGPASAAFAGGSTYYAGKNSQGQQLLFTVDHTANGPMFDPYFTTMTARCQVTGDRIQIGFSFQGFQVPIKNGKINLVLNDLFDRFRWSGTVTSTSASGTQSYATPGFDQAGGLQDCATGPLSWKAQALVPAAAKTAAQASGYLVKITKASDGSVRFTVTR